MEYTYNKVGALSPKSPVPPSRRQVAPTDQTFSEDMSVNHDIASDPFVTGGDPGTNSPPTHHPSPSPSSGSTDHQSRTAVVVPVVVAVVALIALFLLGFWLCRVMRRRHARATPVLPTIAEKPQLLEVRLEPKSVTAPANAKWQQLLPLSAQYISKEEYAREQASLPQDATPVSSRRASVITTSSSSTLQGSIPAKDAQCEPEGRLRVAVAIAMPSPHPRMERGARDASQKQAELCLGVADLPWHAREEMNS
ncbi:hypothetical protein WOLCODRAFT_166055 [Wolfiporia cocos MD-104 SS10]|uniref:Uncharacterized protein n=1 Tax=Wolfiporia cocos (strain MD-104) TaxID=742152 RepID=A0A2H3JGI0_WOLCO|nr:hypothetical protein WOLCODRAFT_166055 [Wolfiporia cocos MD-104 SS10]